MISKYRHKELAWVDLDSPSQDELSYIFDEYAIPINIKEHIMSGSDKNIISIVNDFTFVSISTKNIKNEKIRLIFVITETFMIIIHDEPLVAIRDFVKEMEAETVAQENLYISDTKLLFAHLIKNMYLNNYTEHKKDILKITYLKDQVKKASKQLKILSILSIIVIVIIIILFICL